MEIPCDSPPSPWRLTLAFADGRRQDGRPTNPDAWAELIGAVLAEASAADSTADCYEFSPQELSG